MGENSSSSKSSGIGFFSLLGIVFIILKLCHVINWSWWLVLLPLYGGYAFLFLFFVIIPVFLLFIFRK